MASMVRMSDYVLVQFCIAVSGYSTDKMQRRASKNVKPVSHMQPFVKPFVIKGMRQL